MFRPVHKLPPGSCRSPLLFSMRVQCRFPLPPDPFQNRQAIRPVPVQYNSNRFFVKSIRAKMKKASGEPDAFHQHKLLLRRSRNRAVLSASATINAGICINNELAVSLGNSTHGAVARADAAGNAIIRNLVCHGFSPPNVLFLRSAF